MEKKNKWQIYMILGFLGGLGLALCCAESEEFTIYARNILFENKTHASAKADVQGVLDELITSVNALKGSSGGSSLCPPGYTQSQNGTKILCKNGKDEMARVADFWIDRYELTLVDDKVWHSGACDGTGSTYNQADDTLPSTFPDAGNWTKPIYACSVKGVIPSRSMSAFQAQQACALSGKHLCTNGEWQTAAAGTPDDIQKCNMQTANQAQTTGSNTSCESTWGAMDMVGNLSELVDQWGVSGLAWMTNNAEETMPWPDGTFGPGGIVYGDGKDITRGVNGYGDVGELKPGTFVKGLPAGCRRGGDFDDGQKGGVFNYQTHISVIYVSNTSGARCCRR